MAHSEVAFPFLDYLPFRLGKRNAATQSLSLKITDRLDKNIDGGGQRERAGESAGWAICQRWSNVRDGCRRTHARDRAYHSGDTVAVHRLVTKTATLGKSDGWREYSVGCPFPALRCFLKQSPRQDSIIGREDRLCWQSTIFADNLRGQLV